MPPTVPWPRFNAPVLLVVKFPPMLRVPNVSAFASVIATAFAPVLVRDTTPLKSFAVSLRVIAKPVVVKLDVPPTVELLMPPAP